MKKSLQHLPKQKQNELQKIVETINKNCADVEKIILFGSYARGNFKEEKDIRTDSKSGHISDYDILVVTEKKEIALDSVLWSKISDHLQTLNLSAYPRIITHDITELNKKLSEGQYFFSDIKKEGILLYDLGKFKLASMRELTKQEQQEIAKKHFDHWFDRAEAFFKGYKFFLNEKDYKSSAFNLHQAAEHSYKTIYLVFYNYLPKEHFLEILGNKVTKYHIDLANLFPKKVKEDKDRFKLLEYAYIGGRYDPNYFISKEDLEILEKDVTKLLKITEEICKEKIESFV